MQISIQAAGRHVLRGRLRRHRQVLLAVVLPEAGEGRVAVHRPLLHQGGARVRRRRRRRRQGGLRPARRLYGPFQQQPQAACEQRDPLSAVVIDGHRRPAGAARRAS